MTGVLIESDFDAPWIRNLVRRGVSYGWVFRRRRGHGGDFERPAPGTLSLRRASLIGEAVSVLHSGSGGTADVCSVRLGRSIVAWQHPSEVEAWSRLHRPLPIARWGRPDRSRPWVLVGPDAWAYRESVGAFATDAGLQLHTMGQRGWGRDAVVWWPTSRALGSLLGRVSIVVASPGPLAWDALRAGCEVVAPGPLDLHTERWARQRLAHLVPHPLSRSERFWDRLLHDCAAGVPSRPWGTSHWIREAIDLNEAELRELTPRWRRARQKLRKLRKDPVAFGLDSRWAFLRGAAHRLRPTFARPGLLSSSNATPSEEPRSLELESDGAAMRCEQP